MIVGIYGHTAPAGFYVQLPAENITVGHVWLVDEQARRIAWKLHTRNIPLVISPGDSVNPEDADFYSCTFAGAVIAETKAQQKAIEKLHVRSREDCYLTTAAEWLDVYDRLLAQKEIPVLAVHPKKDTVSLELAKESIEVSLDDYLRFQISQRESLSESLLAFLKEEEAYSQAYGRSLKKLARSDRTAWEIRQDILGHAGTAEMADRVIAKLKANGLLDDERYCREKIQALQASGYGRKYILDYLQRKGIVPAVSGNVYDALPDCEEENLRRFIDVQKKGHSQASLSERKKAVYAACIRRGFDPDAVNRMMGETDFADEKEENRLEQCMRKAVRKYGQDRNQVFRYCYRHGFVSSDIQDRMKGMEWGKDDED